MTDKVWFRITIPPIFADEKNLGRVLASLPPNINPEISRVVARDGQLALPPPAAPSAPGKKARHGARGKFRFPKGGMTDKITSALKRGAMTVRELRLATRTDNIHGCLTRLVRQGAVRHDGTRYELTAHARSELAA